jgi:hypothetical protein
MKESRFKHFLQRLAVRTQFFPFVYLHRGLYALAIRLCTHRLRKIRSVRSICLRRAAEGANDTGT